MNSEQITAFLQEHWYIASVVIGAVILIGAVRNWNWLCDPTGTRDAHRHSRGYRRVVFFLLGVLLIVVSIWGFVLKLKYAEEVYSVKTYCRQEISRGDIYYADLRPVIGSEQGGIRPVLILQNNVGNRHSPTVIAAPITSKMGKPRLPTHVCLNRQANGLSCGSVILLEQLRTIDKSRLRERVGALDTSEMKQIDWALGVSVGLVEGYR